MPHINCPFWFSFIILTFLICKIKMISLLQSLQELHKGMILKYLSHCNDPYIFSLSSGFVECHDWNSAEYILFILLFQLIILTYLPCLLPHASSVLTVHFFVVNSVKRSFCATSYLSTHLLKNTLVASTSWQWWINL